MSFDRAAASLEIARHGAVVRVVVTGYSGSVPRETGASMLVWHDGQSGTIGGGTLELEALKNARNLLNKKNMWQKTSTQNPLGPALGQCCGGSVNLGFERLTQSELAMIPQTGLFSRSFANGAQPDTSGLAHVRLTRAARSGQPATATMSGDIFTETLTPATGQLWLYGAGHVGRALVHVLQDMPFEITWVDTDINRYPDQIPAHATRLVAANPTDAVQHAPFDAVHLVLTYSHALDLEICHHVLSTRFSRLGLIGSATKRARFLSRLRALGHDDATLANLTCPIGQKSLGKRPAAIAIGIAAQLTEWYLREPAHNSDEATA